MTWLAWAVRNVLRLSAISEAQLSFAELEFERQRVQLDSSLAPDQRFSRCPPRTEPVGSGRSSTRPQAAAHRSAGPDWGDY